MKIRVQRIEDGPARVEFIDPSDGAVFGAVDLNVGEEVTIVATTANSPADLAVGEVTEIAEQGDNPEPSDEAPTGNQPSQTGPGGETPQGDQGQRHGRTDEPEDAAA
jgi:hypothetical protein